MSFLLLLLWTVQVGHGGGLWLRVDSDVLSDHPAFAEELLLFAAFLTQCHAWPCIKQEEMLSLVDNNQNSFQSTNYYKSREQWQP